MVINYDTEKLQNTLKHLHNITGINMRFIMDDFTFLPPMGDHNKYCSALKKAPGGDRRCRHSDRDLIKKSFETKKPQIHICYAGLTDAVVPIIHKDTILGYIILGQIKTENIFFPEKIAHMRVNLTNIKKIYDELPYHDTKEVESVIEIAIILVKHILLENMLKLTLVNNIEKATEYIERNLSTPLNIKDIAKKVNISKSTLYNEFHKHFGCTVNEYINKKRIEASLIYLDTTDMSIEEISQAVGFSSASYYSVIFKKIKGISPLRYRQS